MLCVNSINGRVNLQCGPEGCKGRYCGSFLLQNRAAIPYFFFSSKCLCPLALSNIKNSDE